MIYSFAGLIQKANDENEANKQIFNIQQTLLCEEYDLYKNSYAASMIFETDDIEAFLQEFDKTINQFLQQYKEK